MELVSRPPVSRWPESRDPESAVVASPESVPLPESGTSDRPLLQACKASIPAITANPRNIKNLPSGAPATCRASEAITGRCRRVKASERSQSAATQAVQRYASVSFASQS